MGLHEPDFCCGALCSPTPMRDYGHCQQMCNSASFVVLRTPRGWQHVQKYSKAHSRTANMEMHKEAMPAMQKSPRPMAGRQTWSCIAKNALSATTTARAVQGNVCHDVRNNRCGHPVQKAKTDKSGQHDAVLSPCVTICCVNVLAMEPPPIKCPFLGIAMGVKGWVSGCF